MQFFSMVREIRFLEAPAGVLRLDMRDFLKLEFDSSMGSDSSSAVWEGFFWVSRWNPNIINIR